jgi:hypothetical protein
MDTTKCIENNIWETYANNTISEANLIYMENHVKTCELCADVKEGIDAMLVPSLLVNRVDKVNREVDDIIKQKNKIKPLYWYWSAAAILFISFGLVWYNSQNLNNEFAENKTKNETIPPAVFEQLDTTAFLAKKENKQDKVLADNYEPKAIKEVIIDQENENNLTTPQMLPDEVSKESMGETVQTESIKALNEKKLIDADDPTPVRKEQVVIKSASKAKAASIPQAYSNQMQNNNIDFNVNQKQDTINFETAEKLFIKNQFDSSLIYLNNINNFNEEAQFLKAQNLVKTQKFSEAKLLLEALIKYKGKKEKEAKKLLKSLE